MGGPRDLRAVQPLGRQYTPSRIVYRDAQVSVRVRLRAVREARQAEGHRARLRRMRATLHVRAARIEGRDDILGDGTMHSESEAKVMREKTWDEKSDAERIQLL